MYEVFCTFYMKFVDVLEHDAYGHALGTQEKPTNFISGCLATRTKTRKAMSVKPQDSEEYKGSIYSV